MHQRSWLPVSLLLLPILSTAATSEIFPGDFDVAEPSTQVLAAYYYKRDLKGVYINGKPATDGKVAGHAEVLAYTYYNTTRQYLSAWTALLPYVSATTSGEFPDEFGERFSSLSDPRLSYTIWTVNTPNEALAISGTLTLPVGGYKEYQALNSGEHRWKGTLQLGWVKHLSQSITLDFVPEISFYGDNDKFFGETLSQKPTYAITSYLRWAIKPTLETQIGFQLNKGGEQAIDGVDQHNPPDANRYYLGVSGFISPFIALGLRYWGCK